MEEKEDIITEGVILEAEELDGINIEANDLADDGIDEETAKELENLEKGEG